MSTEAETRPSPVIMDGPVVSYEEIKGVTCKVIPLMNDRAIWGRDLQKEQFQNSYALARVVEFSKAEAIQKGQKSQEASIELLNEDSVAKGKKIKELQGKHEALQKKYETYSKSKATKKKADPGVILKFEMMEVEADIKIEELNGKIEELNGKIEGLTTQINQVCGELQKKERKLQILNLGNFIIHYFTSKGLVIDYSQYFDVDQHTVSVGQIFSKIIAEQQMEGEMNVSAFVSDWLAHKANFLTLNSIGLLMKEIRLRNQAAHTEAEQMELVDAIATLPMNENRNSLMGMFEDSYHIQFNDAWDQN